MYVARERTETSAACPDTRYRHSFICSITMVGIGVRRGRGMYESSRKGLAMHGTRHAVVVTHTRLRESGTVVEEAVEQLRARRFRSDDHRQYRSARFRQQDASSAEKHGNRGRAWRGRYHLRAAELVHCTEVPILGVNLGHVGFLAEFESFQIERGDPSDRRPRLFHRRTYDRPRGRMAAGRDQAH